MEPIPAGWTVEGARLVRRLELDRYSMVVAAGAFVALLAMWRDHHPTLILEYRRIVIELISHDVGGVTDRDFAFARWVNAALPVA